MPGFFLKALVLVTVKLPPALSENVVVLKVLER